MRIGLQRSRNVEGLSLGDYAVALCGHAIDDRGRAAVYSLSIRSCECHTLVYDPIRMHMVIDGEPATASELSDLFEGFRGRDVALEATTLGFVEILLCCRALYGIVNTLGCLYVEPGEYRRARDRHLLAKRDFRLSGEVTGFRGIPGATRMLDERAAQKTVFFLGYEGSRFRRAFADLEVLRAPYASVVLGVPAFKAGWEMDAMANNVPILAEENVGRVAFCGADNPRAAAEFLIENYLALQPGEALFVAPIGTKPHGIGTALFLAGRSDVGVIYDHPVRSPDRSAQLGWWHLFTVHAFRSAR